MSFGSNFLSNILGLTGRSLPPSAQAIVLELSTGPKSSKELLNSIDCSTRTVRYAIKTLLEEDLILKEPILIDMRQTRYRLTLRVERMKEQIRNEMSSRLQ